MPTGGRARHQDSVRNAAVGIFACAVARSGAALCRGRGAKNGGIMLDNLHVQRTGTHSRRTCSKIGREMPLGVEINDGCSGDAGEVPGFGGQQATAARRWRVRHRGISARNLEPSATTDRSASKCSMSTSANGRWRPPPPKALAKTHRVVSRPPELGSHPAGASVKREQSHSGEPI